MSPRLSSGIKRSLYGELLHAMETARSRFVVEIVSENKATPRKLWREYLETVDRMRNCIREIRNCGGEPECRTGWVRALDLLKRPFPPLSQDERVSACQFHRRLDDVLAIMEHDRACQDTEGHEFK